MVKGAVFLHLEIKFRDGETGNKYLVFLGNIINDDGNEVYLCCKTTSQKHRLLNPDGCHSKNNIFMINKTPFILRTAIQFHIDAFFEITGFDLLKGKLQDGLIIEKGIMKEKDFNALINCIKASVDVREMYIKQL